MHAPIYAIVYSDSTLENDLIDAISLGGDAAVVRWSRFVCGPRIRRGRTWSRRSSGQC
jgi:hypothetical protein